MSGINEDRVNILIKNECDKREDNMVFRENCKLRHKEVDTFMGDVKESFEVMKKGFDDFKRSVYVGVIVVLLSCVGTLFYAAVLAKQTPN